MRGDPSPAPNGFTLVEVLVALVVTALLLGIVVSGATQAAKREKHSAHKREALLIARERLASASARPFQPGLTRGTAGKLAWEISETIVAADPARHHVLARLSIAISSGSTPLLSAATRKLKPAGRR